jgi:uncharacterized protein YbcV (DUF1398 family)
MLCLSEQHPIVVYKLLIKSINIFHVHENDTSKLVSGKKKRGGVKTSPNTKICTITTQFDPRVKIVVNEYWNT